MILIEAAKIFKIKARIIADKEMENDKSIIRRMYLHYFNQPNRYWHSDKYTMYRPTLWTNSYSATTAYTFTNK